MTRQGWKGFVLAGLLGLTGLATGCTKRDVREGARQTGQELHKATNEVEDATRNASEGFKEGWGGAGTDKTIGDHNVHKDDQGPREQPPNHE
jgi:hypothetical protein